MKEQDKSRCCCRSWDAFEVDYTLKGYASCGAEWEVNLAAVLECARHRLPALQMAKPLKLQWP